MKRQTGTDKMITGRARRGSLPRQQGRLLGNDYTRNNGRFLGIRSEKVSSLLSGPRLYISDNDFAVGQLRVTIPAE
jgi:hypothetical protein